MYSGLRETERWVLPAVIEEQAARLADKPVVSMVGGGTLSYHELDDAAARVAAMLHDQGVRSGDRVAIMVPSGPDFLRAWAGIGRLGAVAVILNCELMGAFLAHPLVDSGARFFVVDPTFVDRLEGLSLALTILTTGANGEFSQWRSARRYEGPLPNACDLACIMYTSGTTGPPKGVLMPHAHCFLFGLGVIDNLGVGPDDHYYICLPLSHANGLLMQFGAALIAGATSTLRERFSASSWLADIRASRATITHTLGAISAFVASHPPTPADRDHGLRLIMSAPNHPDHEAMWRDRFGIPEVIGAFGMTETNMPLYGRMGESRPGTCGRPYNRYFEVEIRNPTTDFPVDTGKIGEICVRPRVANAFMAGYNNLPSQTVEAWRNLWFHTGDAGRREPDGYFTFIDRIKDCIRRRGENISASDIETTLGRLGGVAQVAAYAVPSDIPGGEDEIMLSIVREAGATLHPTDILAHARLHMPRFAQPRYLAFVEDLPRTATEKVSKAALRTAGIIDGTIDLEHC